MPGKGFAVVAQEVKNLASQTGSATEEIAGQIETIQSAIGETVEEIARVSATIDRIRDITTTIHASTEDQAVSASEISRNITEAAEGNREVSANVAQISQAAVSNGEAARMVLGTAQQLNELSGRFNEEIASFLSTVRRAV